MKRVALLAMVLALGILLVSSPSFAGPGAGSGISGSPHDLTGPYGGGTETRVCVFCHAPHHAYKPGGTGGQTDYYPLWNHQITELSYDTYQNTDQLGNPVIPTMTAKQLNAGIEGKIPGQPGGSSKLCLSCHDGSVAVDSYGFLPSSSIGPNANKIAAGTKNFIGGVGTGTLGDLTNHHPIGFNYASVRTAGDSGINDPVGLFPGSTVSINDVLYSGNMECGTCHDVHNKLNQGPKFLWVADTGSQLCLTCHNK